MAFQEGPHLERVKRNDGRRWPILAIGLGIMLVVLAGLRLWAQDPTRPADAVDERDSVVAAASASASASAPATSEANSFFPQCFPNLGWRIASLQQQSQYTVRTAWPVNAAPRPSSIAPNIPTMYGPGIEAIGFCTPGTDELTRGQYVGDVTLWRKSAGGKLSRIDGTVIDATLAEHGEVYLAPPASFAVNGAWPVGDYFFQVRPRGAAVSATVAGARWLPLRIVANPGGSAS